MGGRDFVRSEGWNETGRQAVIMTAAIWLFFVYGSYALSELIAGKTAFVKDLPFDLAAVALVALTAFAMYPLALVTSNKPPAQRWPILLAAAAVVALVQAGINVVENRILGTIDALDQAHLPAIRQRFAASFLSHLYLSFANAALFVFLVEARRSRERGIKLAEARATALRLRLNPHFLFNTLNSISSLLVTKRTEDADQMVEKLCDFLRLSLEFEPDALVPLAEEFGAAEAYLDIEAVRFGERIAIETVLPAGLRQVPVPGLILQALVENAVKYGVARSAGTVTIRIEASASDNRLRVSVSDDGSAEPGPALPGFGIGLDNVRERLRERYRGAARLTAGRHDGGFTATIEIPLISR